MLPQKPPQIETIEKADVVTGASKGCIVVIYIPDLNHPERIIEIKDGIVL